MLEKNRRSAFRVHVQDVGHAQNAGEIADTNPPRVPPGRPGIERLLPPLAIAFVVTLAQTHKILAPTLVAAASAGRVPPDPLPDPVVVLVTYVVGDQLG